MEQLANFEHVSLRDGLDPALTAGSGLQVWVIPLTARKKLALIEERLFRFAPSDHRRPGQDIYPMD